jgi:hypothetical protein
MYSVKLLLETKESLMSNLAYDLSTEYISIFPTKPNVQILQSLPIAPQEYDDLSHEGKYVDEATYWNDYYQDDSFHYEWNNGYLEVKEMPSINCALCTQWFINIVEQYLESNPIACLLIMDIGFKLKLSDKTTIRRPDASLILKSNPCQPKMSDLSYKGIYDVCIEFLSDSKKQYVRHDTVTKKQEYGQANVKEYYIIDVKRTNTAFYRLDSSGRYVPIQPQNGVIKSTQLPGFQFREEDIYLFPELKSLINDPVYQPYVKLDLQKKIQKAEIQRLAKEDAEKKAEIAEKKAKDAEKKAKDAEKKAELERLAKEEIVKENIRLIKLLQEKGISTRPLFS